MEFGQIMPGNEEPDLFVCECCGNWSAQACDCDVSLVTEEDRL
jgi:hypothetical protein